MAQRASSTSACLSTAGWWGLPAPGATHCSSARSSRAAWSVPTARPCLWREGACVKGARPCTCRCTRARRVRCGGPAVRCREVRQHGRHVRGPAALLLGGGRVGQGSPQGGGRRRGGGLRGRHAGLHTGCLAAGRARTPLAPGGASPVGQGFCSRVAHVAAVTRPWRWLAVPRAPLAWPAEPHCLPHCPCSALAAQSRGIFWGERC